MEVVVGKKVQVGYGGSRVLRSRRGMKMYEDVRPCLFGEEVRKRFFNEITSRKQTICRPKRLRVVCVGQT
ncbi:hypothetical protein Hanom_Chr07g00637411 [Helianthus anomalus]